MEVICNQSIFYQKPPDFCISNDMKLTRTNLITISIYSVMFGLSSVFNLTILIMLKKTKSKEQLRIHKFIFNLIIADLIITFITIPLEIGWKYTVYWKVGDFACRLFQFLRPLGIYLASFIIISLCIDRYYAILYPLKIENHKLRTKAMIYLSWILSVVCAIPQIFVFSLKIHPVHRWYTQCMDFKFQLTDDSPSFLKIAFVLYQIFVSTITFFLPLLVILITYGYILMEIIGKLKKNKKQKDNINSVILFSKNRKDTIIKAKRKTLKLAITIVIVFLICWTPYYSISVLFWLDPNMANKIDDRIYNFLFIFAVSNCLANPLVYGKKNRSFFY
ncbi:Gonadotropin-releasing hormone II receptor [Brachionus plicatilis]|uniref:Gonadotropin-releasing hormone II receptor n=1 Tax=Brachionus plicatilis TaxID=10195 RepID=A0A3M7PSN5_BRAPC|nr:Gonadotropin-releasing hormone II receptor [Brachionus plicatilis]